MAAYLDEERQLVEMWFAGKQTKIRAQGLSARLQKDLRKYRDIAIAHLDIILKELLNEKQLSSSSGMHNHGNLTSHIPAPITASEQQWRSLLERAPGYPELIPCHEALNDWEVGDMERLLSGLIQLKAALPKAYQLSRYEASAQYLLGSAKLLDSLDSKSLASFGIDRHNFQPNTTYVVVAGPAEPVQVLLIENPQSFEACIRAGLHSQWVLICTYGYGLKWKQLLESPDKIVGLIRAGCPDQDFRRLLSHPKTFFWGDLDYEGLKIYQGIARNIKTCLLSNLYLPMLADLRCQKGHPYTKAPKKHEQKRSDGLPELKGAIDQERFNNEETLLKYGSGGMTLSEFEQHLPS